MSRILSLLLSLLFFFNCLQSFSQDKPSENQFVSLEGDTVIIKPIPLADITVNAEAAYETLKKIEGRLETPKDLAQFDSLYNLGLQNLLDEKDRIEKTDVFFSVRALDDTKQEWDNYNVNIGSWKEKINTRIRTLESDLFDTDVLNAQWEQTLKNANDGGVPSNVLTSVTSLINKIQNVRKEVVNRQNEALRKQNSLTEISVVIDGVITHLDDIKRQLRSNYFLKDSPPIWKSSDSTTNFTTVKSRLKLLINENARSIESFYRMNEDTVILHIILFLVLWLLYYLLHKQAIKLEDDESLEKIDDARSVISQYGLSALIVSLFLTIWIYPSMITSVGDLVQFFYIVIAIFFLPWYFDKGIRKILVIVLVLYFINEIQILFQGKVFFARILLFVENFLSGWILYTFVTRGSYFAKELRKNKWTILLRIIPIFFIFLIASVLCNILGYVDLAILLENTVVNSLFNLIILILVIMVLKRTIAILIRTPFIQSSNVFKNNLDYIEKRSNQIIQIYAVFLWVKAILSSLGVYEAFYIWITEAYETEWSIGESTTIELGGILIFILVILITIYLTRLVTIILKEDVFPRIKLPRGVPGAITTLITYFIAGYGFFIALSAAGVNLGEFGLIAGALGVGIGFGLQGIVANFIAGLVLAFERPIQVGDEIQLTTGMGVVLKIGVRSTVIRTYNGSEIIIPNSDLITKDVTNWTLSDRKKRRDIPVNVAYGSNPHEVMELLKKVANEHPDVLKVPAPWALFDGFGDSSLNFRIRIWTTMDTGMTVKSDVAINIYDALEDAGIEIPFPQRDLHLRSADPSLSFSNPQAVASAPAKKTRKPKTKNTDNLNKE